ncbi:HET-domain-containing protein [Thozetella sp. PMI_491]|nr:HET-domain-containing protein [Thozetella sp. PMI_491]
MALCVACENLEFTIVTSGQTTEGQKLHRSVARLAASARTCRLCALFLDAISSIRLKGIRNDVVRLFSWASDAQGDPIGMSRVFLRVGDKVGRYVDVFAEPVLQQGKGLRLEGPFQSEALPTRFIKVNKEGMIPELLLVSSRDMTSPYAALSYCWGGSFTGTKTTKTTLKQHYTCIDPSLLPKTIRDATQVTRALGLEYLWVDSLCVVQDDQEDWAAESKRMAGLYQSSTITIVASSAENASQGCLFSRDTTRDYVDVPISVESTGDMSKITFTAHLSSLAEDFLDSPWNKRAWCLQEYVLSPRLLYFFKHRVVWQCRSALSAEDYSELRRDASLHPYASSRLSHLSLRPPTGLDSWFELVEEYSERHLTHSKDKLIAVEALATHLRPYLNSEYVSGLWLNNLHQGLLWLSKDSRVNYISRAHAPSWSWATLDGPVSHLHRLQSSPAAFESTITVRNNFEERKAVDASSLHPLFLTVYLRPVSRSFSLVRNSDFEKVASPLMKGVLSLDRGLEAHYLYGVNDIVCGWAIFDLESFSVEELFCFPAARTTDKQAFQTHFVVILKQSTSGVTMFERVGVGEIVQEYFFSAVEKQDIILL